MILSDILNICLNNKKTISVAESCTSGNIASCLSLLPNSSLIFKGGIIAYQNSIKTNHLSIPLELIQQYTEVCPQVAKLMAENILIKFNSDFSISTTGYAGPSGGNDLDPVGTIYIAVANKLSSCVHRFVLEGNRQNIIEQATQMALDLLYQEIKKNK